MSALILWLAVAYATGPMWLQVLILSPIFATLLVASFLGAVWLDSLGGGDLP